MTNSIARKEAEAAKEALIEALSKKAEALSKSGAGVEAVNAVLKQLRKWVDTEDSKFVHLMITCHVAAKNHGQALKLLNKVLPTLVGDARERSLHELRVQCAAALNATHLVPLLRRAYRRDFPGAPALQETR